MTGGDQGEQFALPPSQRLLGGPAALHAKRLGDVWLKQHGRVPFRVAVGAARPPEEHEPAGDARRGGERYYQFLAAQPASTLGAGTARRVPEVLPELAMGLPGPVGSSSTRTQ